MNHNALSPRPAVNRAHPATHPCSRNVGATRLVTRFLSPDHPFRHLHASCQLPPAQPYRLVSLYRHCNSTARDTGLEGQLECPTPAAFAAFEAGVRRGDLTWHAFPLNAQPELYTPTLFDAALNLTFAEDDFFGCAAAESAAAGGGAAASAIRCTRRPWMPWAEIRLGRGGVGCGSRSCLGTVSRPCPCPRPARTAPPRTRSLSRVPRASQPPAPYDVLATRCARHDPCRGAVAAETRHRGVGCG